MATTRPTKVADPVDGTEAVTPERTGEVSVTLKAGANTAAPWIVARDSSVPGVVALLSDDAMPELVDATVGAATALQAKYAASQPQPEAKAASTTSAAQSATQGTGHFCKHGERQMRSGSTGGRPWVGYFCPTPKGTADQCKPEFDRS